MSAYQLGNQAEAGATVPLVTVFESLVSPVRLQASGGHACLLPAQKSACVVWVHHFQALEQPTDQAERTSCQPLCYMLNLEPLALSVWQVTRLLEVGASVRCCLTVHCAGLQESWAGRSWLIWMTRGRAISAGTAGRPCGRSTWQLLLQLTVQNSRWSCRCHIAAKSALVWEGYATSDFHNMDELSHELSCIGAVQQPKAEI